ncbi:hypothetical protein Vretimale_13855 [Volvox reticuliferus]|uniref:Uncharacterized protein n=1 Tax=Volvox reticuliferus TaxID=1737510 RepID=A0A8J4GL32_9CHLO|nr:hypothetical protein Vretimale_13855 [Volvox reticuliferus]
MATRTVVISACYYPRFHLACTADIVSCIRVRANRMSRLWFRGPAGLSQTSIDQGTCAARSLSYNFLGTCLLTPPFLSIRPPQLIGVYFCNRDWDVSDGVAVRANLGNDEAPHAVHCAKLIRELLRTLRRWLSGNTQYESESEWRMLYGTIGPMHNTDLASILMQLIGVFLYGKEGRKGNDSSDDDDDDEEMIESSVRHHERGSSTGSTKISARKVPQDDKDRNGRSDRAEEYAERDPHWQLYFKMYDIISKLNIHNEKLMVVANCTKAGEAGMSRLAAYMSKTAEIVERLRFLREYRTPFMLRHVSFTLVVASIVMAAPYFAFMCTGSRWEDDTTGKCPAGYFTAVLYVLVLSTLFHVQVALENPFDGVGVDDVFVNMDREFTVTVGRYVRSRATGEDAIGREDTRGDNQADFNNAAATGVPGTKTKSNPAVSSGDKDTGVEAVVKSGARLPSSVPGNLSLTALAPAAAAAAAPAGGGGGGRAGSSSVIEAWRVEDAFQ